VRAPAALAAPARAALALAAFALASPLAGQTAPAAASQEIAAGIAAYDARDPATALDHFRAALRADSTSYEANWRAALAALALGTGGSDSVAGPERDSLYAEAVRDARRAVKANSGDAQGWFVLANALGRAALTQRLEERVKLAGEVHDAAVRAIRLDPKHDGAYHVLGRWNAEIMRLPGVSRFLARQVLGARVFGEASWEGAIANLERAVQLDSTRITHRLDLATVYLDRKRFDDARRQLEAIAALPVRDYSDPLYKRQAAALLQSIPTRAASADRRE